MSIFDAIANAEYRQHISLLATLIKMSYADGKLDENEWKTIVKVAEKYGLEDEKTLKYLRKNYEKYALDTPFTLDERIAQLYDLTKLAYADGHLDDKEIAILKRAVIGLGFPLDKSDLIFEVALSAVKNGTDKETFARLIKDIVLNV